MAERRPFSLLSEKNYRAGKKGGGIIASSFPNHYDAFGRPLRRLWKAITITLVNH
jgi:hypothetical protein